MTLSDSVIRGLRSAAAMPDAGADRYLLGEEIARGGMGTVFRAHDTILDRDVALKVLDRGSLTEARTTAQLEHPGIVPVHDAGLLDDGRMFYAMKLVRGDRLDIWLTRHPTLPERLTTFLRICEPVAFAHSRSVVHRDLKPANIMVGSFGEVLVLDWGIACKVGTAQTAGTAGFSAPEPNATEASDVYSLGRVLSAMLPEPVPPPLAAIATRAAAALPTDRYESVVVLAQEVRGYLAGERVAAYRENVLEQVGRLLEKHRTLASLLAAYLLMRVALMVYTSVR